MSVFVTKYLSALGNSYVFWTLYVFNFRILKIDVVNWFKDFATMYVVEGNGISQQNLIKTKNFNLFLILLVKNIT